jgi:hypothetical protein
VKRAKNEIERQKGGRWWKSGGRVVEGGFHLPEKER